MLHAFPIAGRLALVAALGLALASAFHALTGETIIVSESLADTPGLSQELAAIELRSTDLSSVEFDADELALAANGKSDRLPWTPGLRADAFLAQPAAFTLRGQALEPPPLIFKAAFDAKADRVDPRIAREIGRRVDLMGAIIQAAADTNVDPVYLMVLADKESDFSPGQTSPRSSALGLFQFIDRTWLELVQQFGPDHGLAKEAAQIRLVDGQLNLASEAMRRRILALRADPYLSAVMAGEMIQRDRLSLERKSGRNLTFADSYLGHLLGRGGAEKFIEAKRLSPQQSAAAAFPQAAQANPTMFFANVGEEQKAMSVVQVYDRIARQLKERLARYSGIAASIAKLNSTPPAARDPGPPIGILAFAR